MCRNCKSESEEIKNIEVEVMIKNKKIVVKAPRKICTNCNQIKFDKELDQKFAEKAIEIYNENYGIRGCEIIALRNSLGVSQETFGKVLGVAKKTIVSYENETAIPNDIYYTMINSIFSDKKKFLDFAEINRSKLTAFEIKKIFDRNEDLLFSFKDPFSPISIEEPNEYNGYRRQSDMKRIERMIKYIISHVEGKTKLAKTLFIADMISYHENAEALTGLTYVAATNGPMPKDFECMLIYMIKSGKIRQQIKDIGDCTQYNYYSNEEVELDEKDKFYIDRAINFTKNKSAAYLSRLTHKLDIWLNTSEWKPMSFDLVVDFNLEKLK